jgi:pantetheine-phosphate adenylyltransferase
MTVAVYPGTFDPLTRGHEEIVRCSARLFERVILGVADSDSKRPIFNVEERVAIAREALADVPNVEVRRFSGLMVEFVRACGGQVVMRGVRSVTDFDYEAQLAGMNRHLSPRSRRSS